MNDEERAREIVRFWPRLRREAHDLYREVGILRGRVGELERSLAGSEHALAKQRARNEELTASLKVVRDRLRRIEQSRSWKTLSRVRRALRRAPPVSPPSPPAPEVAVPPPPRREPTFAQRWAAEASRRADAAGSLEAWMKRAGASTGSTIVVVCGRTGDVDTEAFVTRTLSAGDPVCEVEAEGRSHLLAGSIPAGIQPSLVPDLLRMDTAGKDRLLACTAAGHVAIRWVVPAQQEGWRTALVLASVEPSPALSYLATHVDLVVVQDDETERALQEATGVSATIVGEMTPEGILDAARGAPPALPRIVLGID